MRVRFDKLNRFEVPNFTLCNPGSVYNNGALSRSIGVINNTSDEEAVINFDSISELNFRVTKIPSDGSEERDYVLNIYKSIQNRRMIFVDDIGYFVITEIVEDHDEDGVMYKDVTASSCEIEIQNKALIYVEDGTYRFLDLFESIVASIPRWRIGYVDDVIANRYRTFEDVSTSTDTLSFLMEDMHDAYECVFVFDTIHRIINVYDQSNYLLRTDIHLSHDDLIKSMDIRERADDLYTAISVYGEDDLSISAINPLGSTTIYNFSYYLDWMSESLRSKVVAWQDLLTEYSSQYYELNVNYYDLLSQKSNIDSEISRLNLQLDTYTKCRENIVAENNTNIIEDYNSVIEGAGGKEILISDSIEEILSELDKLISDVQGKIDTQQLLMNVTMENISKTDASISDIHNEVSFQNYFTQPEYDELYDYIFEGVYRDDYIVITDSMTMNEKLSQMYELYSKACRKLAAVSTPFREFDIESEAFIFSKEFLPWTEQIEAGCLINIEVDSGEVVELFLTTIQINWHDNDLSLTFGSTFKKSTPQSLFNDVLGDIQKSSNSISYIKDIIYPVKNGMLNSIEDAVNNASVLGLGAGLSSANGEIQIDATGYTGRKRSSIVSRTRNAGGNLYMKEQLKILGNTIVFTEDAWSTCKTLLGFISVMNNTLFGINAGAVVGELIIGNGLVIKDHSGTELLMIVDNKVNHAVGVSISEFKSELEPRLLGITEKIDNINSLIGNVPEGITVVELIDEKMESVRYDDTALTERVTNNEAAIAEIKFILDSLVTS